MGKDENGSLASTVFSAEYMSLCTIWFSMQSSPLISLIPMVDRITAVSVLHLEMAAQEIDVQIQTYIMELLTVSLW